MTFDEIKREFAKQASKERMIMEKLGATPMNALKRFTKGFTHGFRKTWVPAGFGNELVMAAREAMGNPVIKTLKDGTKEIVSGPVGKAFGAGAIAGKVVPPVALIGGLLGTVEAGADIKRKIEEKFRVEPKQRKVFQDLSKNDPILKQYPQKQLKEVFDTMKSITSNGQSTTDKNIVRSFLRNSMAYDGVDYNTAKQLADAEASIQRTKAIKEDSPIANLGRSIGKIVTFGGGD